MSERRAALDALLAENERLREALAQACRDLQQAHNEVLRAQGVEEDRFGVFAWPEWTPQANTIRWAEELLGADFSKRAIFGAAVPEERAAVVAQPEETRE